MYNYKMLSSITPSFYGRLKEPSSMLPTLSKVLATTEADKKRGPISKLLRQVEQLSYLPKS